MRVINASLRQAMFLLLALATVATMFFAASAFMASAPASATIGGILNPPAPPSEECKVPQRLWIVAAEVDPDSLEGCGYFEDPNFHENRKEAGVYNPNGPFSLLFG